MEKVVRVEQVAHPDDSSKNSGDRNLLQDDSDAQVDIFGEEEKAVIEKEQEDQLTELPPNWTELAGIGRRRSCELSKSSTPCVKKAVSHLELIQTVIEDWFRKTPDRSASDTSVMSSAGGTRKQLRFLDNKMHAGTSAGSKSRTSEAMTGASRASTLSVKGVGAQVDEDVSDNELPYLGADDVISEVIVLMARLDNECQETLKKLHRENNKVGTLSKKIDDLCLKRLRDLPVLVQKEHEACIIDLNELQWHVAYRKRMERRLKDRMESAELLNSRYKEDISFVKKHIPLVQEKLQLEVEAMDKIKRAQSETDQELQVTKQRQAKTEQKSEEAASKAETERGYIKKELDTVRDHLDQISEELSEAKMLYNSYVHQINEIKQQLKDNSEELKVLKVKRENAKVADEMQAVKVRELQAQISDAQLDNQKVENTSSQLRDELHQLERRNAQRKQQLDRKLRELESKRRKVNLKNQEAKMEIKDFEDKIAELAKQREADKKKMKRMSKDLENTELMMSATQQEFNVVDSINARLKEELQTKQDDAFRKEETLKQSVDSFRRQVKEEVHSRTVLQARISSDSIEIIKTRTDSAAKKEKAKTIATEVKNAVTNVLVKVEKLRSAKEVKQQSKLDLKTSLQEIQLKHSDSKLVLEKKISEMSPYHDKLKEDIKVLEKKEDHMTWQAQMMKKNIEEMDSSSEIMIRVQNTTEKIIKDLKEDLIEQEIKLGSVRSIQENLIEMYQNLSDKLYNNDHKHKRLIDDRNVVLARHKDVKHEALKRNKELASRYRQLQNEYFTIKEKLLHGYEDQVKTESSLKDVKRLHSLQRKLHAALTEYFKLSGLYHKQELQKLNDESSLNGQQIEHLQHEMNVALAEITQFLKEEMTPDVKKTPRQRNQAQSSVLLTV